MEEDARLNSGATARDVFAAVLVLQSKSPRVHHTEPKTSSASS